MVYWFRGRKGGGYGPRQELLAAADGYSMTTANAADLDGDGLVDLVLGDTSGRVLWSRNEGTRQAPVFRTREPLRTLDGHVKVCHKSDPWPCDWDGDGRLDLLVGDETTDVVWFRGVVAAQAQGITFAPGVSLFSGQSVDGSLRYAEAKARLGEHRAIPGYRVRVGTADWNGDGRLDLLLGNCVREDGRTTGHVWVLLRR